MIAASKQPLPCPECDGSGRVVVDYDGDSMGFEPCWADCGDCDGSGEAKPVTT